MIIDNKQSYGSNPDVKTVWDCILSYTDPSARVGRMDVVTGFFSIAALHLLYQELSENNSYRMVLGDIHDMKRDEDVAKVYGSTKPEKCHKAYSVRQSNYGNIKIITPNERFYTSERKQQQIGL